MLKDAQKLVKYVDWHAMENNKQKVKFVIFYTNFKVGRKYQNLLEVNVRGQYSYFGKGKLILI